MSNVEIKKPSEKLVDTGLAGVEVIDSLGRKFILKNPDILDEYDLLSALGQDANNKSCVSMATMTILVSSIDGEEFHRPTSYTEIRVAIKRIGKEGMDAISKHLEKLQISKTEKEAIETIKK